MCELQPGWLHYKQSCHKEFRWGYYIAEERISMGCFRRHRLRMLKSTIAVSMGSWERRVAVAFGKSMPAMRRAMHRL